MYIELDAVEEKKLESGIFVPRMHSELTRLGTIRAVGKEVDTSVFNVGDRVMLPYISGYNIYFPDKAHLSETQRIVSQENILCKVEEGEPEAKSIKWWQKLWHWFLTH